MTPAIHVLNGPNLNLLGEREPDIYGRETMADVEALCRAEAGDLSLTFRQTNAEHEMVDWVQAARRGQIGIVINPAAFSYAGYPLLDALKMVDCPLIEVHISNIHARSEAWRSHSLISPIATGIIAGMGVHGYALAVRDLVRRWTAR
jgi:3-dehydroquinate dehydratase-2